MIKEDIDMPKIGQRWKWANRNALGVDKHFAGMEMTITRVDLSVDYIYSDGHTRSSRNLELFVSNAVRIDQGEQKHQPVIASTDYVEPVKTCEKDCTPSSPCWTWDVCPVIKETRIWTMVRKDYWLEKREQVLRSAVPDKAASLPEPMRSGAGGLVCDWILRK